VVRFPAEERNSYLQKSVQHFSDTSSDRPVTLTTCLYLMFRSEICSLYFHYPTRIQKILLVLCVYCTYFMQSRYIKMGHTRYARRLFLLLLHCIRKRTIIVVRKYRSLSTWWTQVVCTRDAPGLAILKNFDKFPQCVPSKPGIRLKARAVRFDFNTSYEPFHWTLYRLSCWLPVNKP